ncbi:hypothetical protein A5725_13360 [Mycobacterium kubicae]|uniref:DUF4129 domain-containing protein n=1 Tax=Mycobacterium kubicae TaxID=120959 RepID=UPI0007FC6567|nr:DUF4129 domain-containing protein [Mycobacterium kubicae]OBF21770.1 hypothetical protein A5725_13360 [Mycobacterium kubicae]
MPGIDKPTGRVVLLIALVIVAAASLRGYLPPHEGKRLADSGENRAMWAAIIAMLAGTLAILTVAIIARLRDPRTVAPSAGQLPELLGRGKERPSWRVVLIGLALVVAWLFFAALLSGLAAPPDVDVNAPPPDPSGSPPATGTAPARTPQPAHKRTGDTLGILLATTVPLLVLLVAGAVAATRRRRTPAATGAATPAEAPAPPSGSGALVRAAEVGLAEIADHSRDPRAAIIACYAAMERELANVPGAVPQEFDTPSEVLARAVQQRALHADNAVQLVNLFAEARFSSHVMNEGHREVAVRVLELVLDELAPQSRDNRSPV